MTITSAPTGRTRRSPDGMFASVGAVRQSGGSLPIYICNTCGSEVVWAESKRTGRKYLANIHHGYLGQRFYIAASLHDCAPILARREERDWADENNHDAQYLLSLVDEHDEPGHPSPIDRCLRCERMTAKQAIDTIMVAVL